ncbi:MAG: response regulator [Gallionellaceae bacterium]|nr:response regulator [Gallionellaceae bacterium]
METASRKAWQGCNALLIEDDPLTAGMACRAAAESCPGLNLTVVGCGVATLDWLSESVARKEPMPHIILLDMKLPKLDGLAVLRKLRIHAATRDIPVVAFSAEYTQADVLLSYQVGVNSFIAKPVEQRQFMEFFCGQLAYWLHPRQRQLDFKRIQ